VESGVQKCARGMAAMPIMFIWSRGTVYSAAKHEDTGNMSEALLEVAEVEGFGG